jgi:hypothetical protein
MKTLVLLGICLAAPLAAEGPISLGVRAGVPFRDLVEGQAFQGSYYDVHRTPFIFGPTVIVNLPAGFGIQADAIFRRYRFRAAPAGSVNLTLEDDTWIADIPVMLRWQWNRWPVSPFVNGGVAFRNFSDIGRAVSNSAQGNFGVVDNFTTGYVVGAGVRFKLGVLKLAPEIRYSRFDANNFSGNANAIFRTVKDQADFLVGFYF